MSYTRQLDFELKTRAHLSMAAKSVSRLPALRLKVGSIAVMGVAVAVAPLFPSATWATKGAPLGHSRTNRVRLQDAFKSNRRIRSSQFSCSSVAFLPPTFFPRTLRLVRARSMSSITTLPFLSVSPAFVIVSAPASTRSRAILGEGLESTLEANTTKLKGSAAEVQEVDEGKFAASSPLSLYQEALHR